VGIELNHKSRNEVKKGDPAVAIRIEMPSYNTAPTYGRHFVQEDDIYSKVRGFSLTVDIERFD
jgi:translation initiation factor 5B